MPRTANPFPPPPLLSSPLALWLTGATERAQQSFARVRHRNISSRFADRRIVTARPQHRESVVLVPGHRPPDGDDGGRPVAAAAAALRAYRRAPLQLSRARGGGVGVGRDEPEPSASVRGLQPLRRRDQEGRELPEEEDRQRHRVGE